MPDSKPRLTTEFMFIMTMIGVAVAVLVLVIDQQIKRDIVTHATAARLSVDKLTTLLAEKGDSHDAGPQEDTADSAS